MIYHEPYGTAKVNVKHRGFSWDDVAPMAGEQPKKDFTSLWHGAIDWATVITIVLFGWWLMDWWWNGGYHLMRDLLVKYCGWLMSMTQNGHW